MQKACLFFNNEKLKDWTKKFDKKQKRLGKEKQLSLSTTLTILSFPIQVETNEREKLK